MTIDLSFYDHDLCLLDSLPFDLTLNLNELITRFIILKTVLFIIECLLLSHTCTILIVFIDWYHIKILIQLIVYVLYYIENRNTNINNTINTTKILIAFMNLYHIELMIHFLIELTLIIIIKKL